jgi:hypothetical protein
MRSTNDPAHPIECIGTKVLYNLDDGVPASKWVRQEVKGLKTHDAPQMASALVVNQKGRGLLVEDHIGYMASGANSIYKNGTGTFLVSSSASVGANAGGFSVIPANFRKCCALFTARRTIKRTWLNWQDEYSAPNEQHPDYEQWNTDAIVYSLFNPKSNQSSLRDIAYKGKTWQIHNQWFWLARQRMITLADEQHNDAVYQDARTDAERYVHTTLAALTLTADAQAVLDKATDLLVKTFEYRERAADEHPEWHSNTWDAGWYQVKLLLKQHLPADLKAFQVLYHKLGNRLREGVYTLGFLRK